MGAYCYTILKERYTRLPQSEISIFDNQNHLNRFENLSAWKQKKMIHYRIQQGVQLFKVSCPQGMSSATQNRPYGQLAALLCRA